MSADLTCEPCEGTGHFVCRWPGCEQRHPQKMCLECHGRGRRRPELYEWDALKDERDRYRAILAGLLECELCRSRGDTSPCGHWDWAFARAALDSDPDLAERTRRIKADE